MSTLKIHLLDLVKAELVRRLDYGVFTVVPITMRTKVNF